MSTDSQAQQSPELPATHTNTALSPQHQVHQATANSTQPLSQPLQQTSRPQSYPTNYPQYPPSHPQSYYPHNPPSQPSHPLEPMAQYSTHDTASHTPYQPSYPTPNPWYPPPHPPSNYPPSHPSSLPQSSHPLQPMPQFSTHDTASHTQYQHSYPTHNPRYPPPHPPSNYPQNLAPHPYSLPQSSHPLRQVAQHPTHLTPSHLHSQYRPPLQLRHGYHSLSIAPSFPHTFSYTATQPHRHYSSQHSTQGPPHMPPTLHPSPHHPAHQLQHNTQFHPHSSYTQYQTMHPPTHYTPLHPPTCHQLPTPYQPPHTAGSTGDLLEESGPSDKRARLEPSASSHSALRQHNITSLGTTDCTPSGRQLRATQPTAHSTPPNPLLTDDSSVSGQPHTSATPPMQSSPRFQSSSSDSPQTTTPATELLVHQQSRMVDNVLTRYTSQLTEAFSSNLHYFSNKFIELDFINRDAASEIDTMGGIGNRGKANKLLDLVIANFRISHDPKTWFSEFVSVFSSEAPYASLAMSMREDFEKNVSHSSSIPCTTRPSLPLSEPQSIYTNIQSRMSSQLQGSTPLDAIIDHVKTTYRESKVERQTAVVKWPPTPSKVYINLACLDRHSVSGRSRKYDEVTEAMVRDGNVDAIVNVTKGPIDFSEIAKNISITNSRERATSDKKKGDKKRLILVEGAPGVGKSTFALEFCRRWERGEIAQQYQLVLLLRLREERISNAKSLKDLIYHPLEDVPQAVCHELVHSHDFHALIILEGFDELPDISRKSGSVFMDLIAGKLLPLATVLVTSRPWATEGIRLFYGNRIYQHIEILGFTGHQITEYIESVLPQDKASDLKAYLESHPQIRACMYIPLNSAIVVTVYEESQDSECPMPSTLTDLYTSLSLTLLLRYLRGHPEYEADCKSLRTFKDLPQPVYAKFCKVCKLAYDGTVGNIPFYLESDYSTRHQVQLIFRNLLSDFDDLGFMDSVTELYVTQGAVSSYNFLHLTFQEFFTAVHISNMSPAQQAEHFNRLEDGRLKVVLRFLAGFNKLNCLSIEEIARNFFQTPSTHEGSRYLMSCDAAVGIDLVQWLFEAQSEVCTGTRDT